MSRFPSQRGNRRLANPLFVGQVRTRYLTVCAALAEPVENYLVVCTRVKHQIRVMSVVSVDAPNAEREPIENTT